MNLRDSLERGGVPAVREDTGTVGFSDLAEERITRARAIKLAGATLTAGALAAFLSDEADALTRKQRRRRRLRRRRRRRQAAVTSEQSTINFGGTTVGAPVVRPVPITNSGSTPVTIDPQLVGDGFTLVDASGAPIAPGTTVTLAPGETAPIFVRLDALEEGAQTGELRIRDAADNLLLETVDLTGTVTAPVTP